MIEFLTDQRFIEAASFFGLVMVEMAVLFIGVSFLVNVLTELFPSEQIGAILSGKKGRGYLAGAGLGAITPFCSCSTIPMTVGLLRANAGFGPTMAFLFTSPLVNPMLIALLWMALGWRFTALYTFCAILFTLIISFLLDRFNFQRFIDQDAIAPTCGAGKNQNTHPNDTSTGGAFRRLLANKARLKELLANSSEQYRTFLPYIAIGIAIGAISHGFIPENYLVELAGSDNPWAIPASAVIGIPLYLRASTMVPMIMPLAAKGVALGALAALIIGAAGASLPEVIMLKRLFRLPLMAAFLLSVFTIAIATGFAFEWLIA